jgi:Fic family protein
VPLAVLTAAFNLDFLCIHPFRDGNGRVSRLLFLLQTYHMGHEVGRYISLERLIEENKERYYETLEISSQRWHEGRHGPWPFINFMLFILGLAHRELERRMAETTAPRGGKTALVQSAVAGFEEEFTLRELRRACPAVSPDMIRRVLRDMRREGRVKCLGRGPGARWRLIVRR